MRPSSFSQKIQKIHAFLHNIASRTRYSVIIGVVMEVQYAVHAA
jgi:hypothetical protein